MKKWHAFLVFPLALFLCYWIHLQNKNWHQQIVETRFESECQSILDYFGKEIQSETVILDSLLALFKSSPFVDFKTFQTYSREILNPQIVQKKKYRPTAFSALEWVPIVRGYELKDFILQYQQLGLQDFKVHGVRGKDLQITSESIHYPVTYIEPLEPNRAALGLDLASEQARKGTVDKCFAEHQLTATQPIELVQDKNKSYATLLMLPWIDHLNKPRGVVLGVLKFKDLFIKNPINARLVDFEIQYLSPNSTTNISILQNPSANPLDLQSQKQLVFADQSFHFIFTPTSLFKSKHPYQHPWGTFFLIFLVSILTYFGINLLLEYNRNVSQEVQTRTQELSISNQSLLDTREELKAALDQAVLSEERLYLAVRGSNDGLWDWDIKTNQVYYSPRFKELLGYNEHEFKNNFDAWKELLHPEDLAHTEEAIEKHFANKENFEVEYRLKTKSGEWKWFLDRGKALRSQDGQPFRMAGSISDITKRKNYELQIKHAQQEAILANQSKTLFLSRISHELRTPLNAIIGFTQILKNDSQIAPHLKEQVQIIHESGHHLLELINDLLDLTQLDAGKMSLNEQPTQLNQELEQIKKLFIQPVKDKGLFFEFTIETLLPNSVSLDPKRFKQILINLISNAIKYTEQGKIRILINGEHDLQDKNIFQLNICIQDTGKGIDASQLHKIFEPFHQASDEYSEGAGLGLSIVAQLIELMKGDIAVKSEKGSGTEFSLYLPLQILDHQEPQAKTSAFDFSKVKIQPNTSQKKVLIVDDIFSNRLLLRSILESLKLSCIEAISGQEGIDLALKENPDIIFMDLLMPGINGHEAATEIKKHAPKILIIAITASTRFSEKDSFLKAYPQFNDVVYKPIGIHTLIQALEHHGLQFIKEHSDTMSDSPDHSDTHDIASILKQFNHPVKEKLIESISFQDYPHILKLLENTPELPIACHQKLAEEAKNKNSLFFMELTEHLG